MLLTAAPVVPAKRRNRLWIHVDVALRVHRGGFNPRRCEWNPRRRGLNPPRRGLTCTYTYLKTITLQDADKKYIDKKFRLWNPDFLSQFSEVWNVNFLSMRSEPKSRKFEKASQFAPEACCRCMIDDSCHTRLITRFDQLCLLCKHELCVH